MPVRRGLPTGIGGLIDVVKSPSYATGVGLVKYGAAQLGLHRVVAYNIVFLSGFVLSGVTMFVLVRALTGCFGSALVAGAIFAVMVGHSRPRDGVATARLCPAVDVLYCRRRRKNVTHSLRAKSSPQEARRCS